MEKWLSQGGSVLKLERFRDILVKGAGNGRKEVAAKESNHQNVLPSDLGEKMGFPEVLRRRRALRKQLIGNLSRQKIKLHERAVYGSRKFPGRSEEEIV